MTYCSEKRRKTYEKTKEKYPLINIYTSMKARCLNKNHCNYKYYGQRGIKVCDRWLESYENFASDMGDRPSGYTLDRIDPDKGYEPSNCRWASNHTQALNRRVSGKIKEKYISIRKNKRSYRYRVKKGHIDKIFFTLEEAIEFRDKVMRGVE